jgi:hypothetical protein
MNAAELFLNLQAVLYSLLSLPSQLLKELKGERDELQCHDSQTYRSNERESQRAFKTEEPENRWSTILLG